jgi:hypothetical protein
MPGGGATKPGDVVTAMNGKTIQVRYKYWFTNICNYKFL